MATVNDLGGTREPSVVFEKGWDGEVDALAALDVLRSAMLALCIDGRVDCTEDGVTFEFLDEDVNVAAWVGEVTIEVVGGGLEDVSWEGEIEFERSEVEVEFSSLEVLWGEGVDSEEREADGFPVVVVLSGVSGAPPDAMGVSGPVNPSLTI